MKVFAIFSLLICSVSCATNKDTELTRNILLEELKNNHNVQDWYVPLGIAIEDLTEEQVNWKNNTEDHSIKELAAHLSFWNQRILSAFKGIPVSDFDGNNESTFKIYDDLKWVDAINNIDSIQAEWENAMQNATKRQLEKWGSEIAGMSSHIAYHTGQIVYLRKTKGWWNTSK